MITIVICLVAFAASALTFFSGFGLGTLLMPAFALFFPVEQAVVWTAIVHFLNGVFKVSLVGRHANWRIVRSFGVPAIVGALAGSFLLGRLATGSTLFSYSIGNLTATATPVKMAIGLVLLLITFAEWRSTSEQFAARPQFIPIGGFFSGFLGGLSGMQGALRSAFLIRAGLSKEAYIGTGVMVAMMIDISRLTVYLRDLDAQRANLDYRLLGAAVLSAFLGAFLANRYLEKVTLAVLQRVVAVLLVFVAVGLMSGVL
ncbi:MAG: sulfite exporter TauE/SafE family protein [Phycisphaerae bacterium]|nr:sulfite exporter TauE/SafE family protein [Gemmatimonadaceae bacterium]